MKFDNKIRYFLYGQKPILYVPSRDGGLQVRVVEATAPDGFTLDPKYYPEIAFDRDGLAQSLTRPQFLKTLERLGITTPIAQLEASA
jgi:hypothetical protein